nr:hypothetical protein [Tanacetum cinerariifolium]
MYIVVVGDRAKAFPGLSELGYDVVELDVNGMPVASAAPAAPAAAPGAPSADMPDGKTKTEENGRKATPRTICRMVPYQWRGRSSAGLSSGRTQHVKHIPRVAVTGKVTDKTGAEIPGVTVLVKGTGQGAATDVNGVFKLNCAPDSRLVFSFLGYVAQEVPLEGRTTVNVSLASDSKQLDDVVVVGYGTQTKAEFTGAAARVSGDAVKDLPVQSFDQGLAGKATGVSIGQPNGVLNNAPVIRI